MPVNYFRAFKSLIITLGTALAGLICAAAMFLYLTYQRSSAVQRANGKLSLEVSRRTRVEAEVRELNRNLNILNRDLKNKVEDFQTLLKVAPVGIAVASDPECPVEMPAKPAQQSRDSLTQWGIGTVRTRLFLPMMSASIHRLSTCLTFSKHSPATLPRRRPQPTNMARMAGVARQSRFPACS